jgi:predicted ATP-grasp superfamily ATP-dependent carboligase
VACYLSREGVASLQQIDADGKVQAITADEADELLEAYAEAWKDGNPRNMWIGEELPFGDRSIFVDVTPAKNVGAGKVIPA